jgi:hypothetical protein
MINGKKHPEHAWKAIVEIYAQQPDELALSNLAAGPLEDLFVYHGRVALTWADQYCASDAGFVKVLKMVWRNAMSDKVWVGLNRVIERYT